MIDGRATVYACVTAERPRKTYRLMAALRAGWPGAVVSYDAPPAGKAFFVWGQRFLSERIIPQAEQDGTPYIQIDNGYHLSAGGTPVGFYRLTYRGLGPLWLPAGAGPLLRRPLARDFAPWRRTGRKVLVAAPGRYYGAAQRLDLSRWTELTVAKLRQHTDRPVVVREKGNPRPLAADLADAFALVTYGSAAAVEAAVAGVPVFCARECAASPVGLSDLSEIESPVYPDREEWWRQLMAQQFTIAEMRSGLAFRHMAQFIQHAERPANDSDIRFEPAN